MQTGCTVCFKLQNFWLFFMAWWCAFPCALRGWGAGHVSAPSHSIPALRPPWPGMHTCAQHTYRVYIHISTHAGFSANECLLNDLGSFLGARMCLSKRQHFLDTAPMDIIHTYTHTYRSVGTPTCTYAYTYHTDRDTHTQSHSHI